MPPTIKPVSQHAKDTLMPIIEASGYNNLVIASSALDGEPVDVLAAVTTEDGAEYEITPLAIVVDDALFERLSRPDADLPSL